MNLKSPSRRDDFLFVIALLLPAVFAGVRYFESNREMVQIAQAQSHRGLAASDRPDQPHVHIVRADTQSF